MRNVILCTDCRQFLYVSQGEIKAQSDRNSNLGLELPTHYKISALPDKIKKNYYNDQKWPASKVFKYQQKQHQKQKQPNMNSVHFFYYLRTFDNIYIEKKYYSLCLLVKWNDK